MFIWSSFNNKNYISLSAKVTKLHSWELHLLSNLYGLQSSIWFCCSIFFLIYLIMIFIFTRLIKPSNYDKKMNVTFWFRTSSNHHPELINLFCLIYKKVITWKSNLLQHLSNIEAMLSWLCYIIINIHVHGL